MVQNESYFLVGPLVISLVSRIPSFLTSCHINMVRLLNEHLNKSLSASLRKLMSCNCAAELQPNRNAI